MPRIDDLLRGPDLSTLRLSAETSQDGQNFHVRIA